MILKMSKNFAGKRGEHFNIALAVIFVSMAVSLLAFMSEDKNSVTGFATAEYASSDKPDAGPLLNEFNNIRDLGSLAKGSYYIDNEGIVYWLDDSSKPAVAKLNYIQDAQKNRLIYIDGNGNIGYVLR